MNIASDGISCNGTSWSTHNTYPEIGDSELGVNYGPLNSETAIDGTSIAAL